MLYPVRPGDRLILFHGNVGHASGDIFTVIRTAGDQATLSDGDEVRFLSHRLLFSQREDDIRVWMVAFPKKMRQEIEVVGTSFAALKRTAATDGTDVEIPDGRFFRTRSPDLFKKAVEELRAVLSREATERYPEEAEALTRLYVAQISSVLFSGL